MIHRSPRLIASTLLASLALATTCAHAQLQTARLIKDANFTPGDLTAGISWVMPLGKKVVFPMDTLKHGSELWISNGTTAGTRLLKDLTPGPGSTIPENPVAFGGEGKVRPQIAFRSLRYSTGNEVWVTDGTSARTIQLFKSEIPGFEGETRIHAGTPRGVFFENAIWSENGDFEIFFSDGTRDGTISLNPMGDEGRRFGNAHGFVANGPWCYFIANRDEIWRSDGTPENTTKQLTVTAGWPQRLAFVGDRVYTEVFIAYESSQLWTSLEGGELTRIELPEETTTPERIDPMIALGDQLFFVRYEELHQNHVLWVSDGTTAGTRRIPLQHLGQGDESHPLGEVTLWKDALYVAATADDGTHELWRTDGTPAGTTRLTSFTDPQASLEFYFPQASTDFLYFQTADAEHHHHLWRTDGSASNTLPVRSTEALDVASEWPTLAGTSLDTLFFVADHSSPHQALWHLRERNGRTVRLTKPETTSASSIPLLPVNGQPHEMFDGRLLQLVNTGSSHELWTMKPNGKAARSLWIAPAPMLQYGTLGFHATTSHGAIFSFHDGGDLRQLWTTDGTSDGTRLLGDFSTAHEDGQPRDFAKVGDTWFFSVINYNTSTKSSLWKTDGTPEGTVKVSDKNGKFPHPEPGDMVEFQGSLHFIAADDSSTIGLWRSDGTAAGTVRVKDGWYRFTGYFPKQLSVVRDLLHFTVRESSADHLWRSDGTALGTVRVTPPNSTLHSLSKAVDLNGSTIFHAGSSVVSIHLWRYENPGLTLLRSDIAQHVVPWNIGYPRIQAIAGTRMFFSAVEGYQTELWITDGTDAGTRMVKDINPGPWSSEPTEMLAVGDVIYFSARDEQRGTELWRSDGTEAGTILIADIEPGPGSSDPRGLKAMNGKLYFTAHRRNVGRELFSIDLPK